MHTRNIIQAAHILAHDLNDKDVDSNYINQLCQYLLNSMGKLPDEEAKNKFVQTVNRMPESRFAERGSLAEKYQNASSIIIKALKRHSNLTMNEFIQILAWTTKIMKYKELTKGEAK